MKRNSGVLLIVMALFGLTACGGNSNTKPTVGNANKVLVLIFPAQILLKQLPSIFKRKRKERYMKSSPKFLIPQTT